MKSKLTASWNFGEGAQPWLTNVLSFIISIGPISMDMYLPAFQKIGQEYGPAVPQLTLACYLAGLAFGQIPYGPISDRIGRRPTLFAGLTLYVLGSAGCALSPAHAPVWLCAGRALAGFGAAASIVLVRTMVRDLAPEPTAAALRLFSIFAWLSVAPLIAPLAGSAVLRVADWRAIFWVAAAYGAVCVALVRFCVPETLSPRMTATGREPLLRQYEMIFADRGFVSHALIGVAAMSALFTYFGGSSVVFMTKGGLPPSAYSAVLAGIGGGCFVFLRYQRRLVTRACWPLGRVIDFDLKLFLAGALFTAPIIWVSLPWPGAFLSLAVCAAGFMAVQPSAQAGAVAGQAARAGLATSAMSTMQYGGGALANMILGHFADGTGRPMAVLLLATAGAAWLAAHWRPAATRSGP